MKNSRWLNSIINLWHKYKIFVETAASQQVVASQKNVKYWREKIFLSFVLYAVPFGIAALIPQVYSGVKQGKTFMVVFDLLCGIIISCIALNKNISIAFRKTFVAVIMYLLTVVLITNLGMLGPGIIYLLAISIFLTVVFPRKIAYWFIVFQIVTFAFFALVIYLKLFNSPLIIEYNFRSWVAFSFNLFFLSLMSVMLISKIINALESRIVYELELKNKLELEAEKSKELHFKLQESENHYKTLFIQNPSPMWVYDFKTLRFLQVNDAAVQQYGYTRKEFLLMTIKEIRSAESLDELSTIIKNINKGKTNHVVTKHCTKDQQSFEVDIRGNSIQFQGKEARLIIARNISEQVKHIKAIEEQNKKFQEIAFIQSHLVRAPLAWIMGLVDILITDKQEKPDIQILKFLERSALDFDEIIKTITKNTEQYDLKR